MTDQFARPPEKLPFVSSSWPTGGGGPVTLNGFVFEVCWRTRCNPKMFQSWNMWVADTSTWPETPAGTLQFILSSFQDPYSLAWTSPKDTLEPFGLSLPKPVPLMA